MYCSELKYNEFYYCYCCVCLFLCLHVSQASHFGRTFLKNLTPPSIVDNTVTAGQYLRILNQIRQPEVGIPLTMTQYP